MNEENLITLQLNGEKGRIDKVLTDKISDISRSSFQKLIQNQKVIVNNNIIKANYKTMGNEIIEIYTDLLPDDEEEISLNPENIPLDIIYEDNDVIVINKQKGLVVHPSKGHSTGTLVNGLLYYLENNLSNIENKSVRPGIVHRIDKDTSGLIVVAKNNKSHEFLSKQLENHTMKRTYIALAYGNFKSPSGKINIPLARNPKNRIKYTGVKNGKPAITHFTVIKQFEECALLECQLETGRTHQIRAHLEYIKHPIIGDSLYTNYTDAYSSDLTQYRNGQFLHAKEISFIHPKTKKIVEFHCDIPDDFKNILKKIEVNSKQ